MTTVFVAGSISIKRLHPLFLERLDTIVSSGFNVVVGDADGADRSIQQALYDRGAKLVTVYCSGTEPRNNVGGWKVQTISPSSKPGSRAFYTAKDIEMARVADYGLMAWDAKSPGTLSNVIELLKRERSTRIFVNEEQQFITASDAEGLKRLVSVMSPTARGKADEKIGLSAQLAAFESRQFDFSPEGRRIPMDLPEEPLVDRAVVTAGISQGSMEAVDLPDGSVVVGGDDFIHPASRPGSDQELESKRLSQLARIALIALLGLSAIGAIIWLRG